MFPTAPDIALDERGSLHAECHVCLAPHSHVKCCETAASSEEHCKIVEPLADSRRLERIWRGSGGLGEARTESESFGRARAHSESLGEAREFARRE